MTFDFDDAYDGHDAIDHLERLWQINNDFRCTLFAIPGLCSPLWCEQLPDWVELAVHGWTHHDNYECAEWTREQMEDLLERSIVKTYFTNGFKAPGWQISDACYEVLWERDWWVADQHLEDHRRPPMRVYFYEDGGWHGHIDDVCGNGIVETWEKVVELASNTQEFRWCGEAASFYPDPDDSGAGEDAGRVSGLSISANPWIVGASARSGRGQNRVRG